MHSLVLPPSLLAVVDSEDRVADLPICSLAARERFQLAIDAEKAKPLVTPDFIAHMFGALVIAFPKRQRTDDEAEAFLKLAVPALVDIPQEFVEAAAVDAVKTQRFMPGVAELRELAWRAGWGKAKWRLMRMQAIVARHDREYRPEQPNEIEHIPLDEIRTWQPSYRKTALDKGWITKEQFDACAPEDEAI